MEALLVSPLRPWQIIVGKVAPYLAIGFVSVVGVHRRGAAGLRRAAARQRGAAAGRERALHPRVALARHSGLGAHLVAARRDDGRAGRHDAADDAALRVHLSGREHAAAAADRARTSCRRAGSCSSRAASCSRASASTYLWRETLVSSAMAVVLLARCSTRVVPASGWSSRCAASCFLARAEVLHVVRDRATLAQVLVLPIVQLLVLSNAATFEIRNTPVYVVDLDRTSASRGLVSRFAASGHFRIVGQSASLELRRTRRCCAGDVDDGPDDPARLRGVARADGRRRRCSSS